MADPKLKSILERRSKEYEQAAQRNRSRFPVCSEFLDRTREIFGQDCSMVWASENGNEIGKKPNPGVVPSDRPENQPKRGRKGKQI